MWMLNVIRKMTALLNAVCNVDYKLTCEGHFRTHYINQVCVMSVVDSLLKKPVIHQNGGNIHVDNFDLQHEGSARPSWRTHPTSLTCHSFANPELYEGCFSA